MTIEDLRADYAAYTDSSSLEGEVARERIMSAVPIMLDLLEKAIAWRKWGDDGIEASEVGWVVDAFNGDKSCIEWLERTK